MQRRIVYFRNGRFRVCGTPDLVRHLTPDEIWTAQCQMRREAVSSALLTSKCPERARLIPLVGSRRVLIAIVDEEDYPRLSRLTWLAWTRRGYAHARAVTRIDGRLHQLSRLVLNVGHRYHHVLHANGNTLDCRKSNLRVMKGKPHGVRRFTAI